MRLRYGPGQLEPMIVEELTARPQQTAMAIRQRLEIGKGAVHRILAKMIDDGRAFKDKYSRYSLRPRIFTAPELLALPDDDDVFRYDRDRTAVYRCYDAAGSLLYVGISLSPAIRLAQHQVTANWFGRVASITVDWANTREEALGRERLAIADERPQFNVAHR